MTVRLHASVVVGGEMKHVTFDVDHEGLATLGDLFDRADERQLLGQVLFADILARAEITALAVLHNGRRLDLPEALGNALRDGDEVSLLTPMVGG